MSGPRRRIPPRDLLITIAAALVILALPAIAKAHIPWEAAKAPEWFTNATRDFSSGGAPGCRPYGYESAENETAYVEWLVEATDSGSTVSCTMNYGFFGEESSYGLFRGDPPINAIGCEGDVSHQHTTGNPPRGRFQCGALYDVPPNPLVECGRVTETDPTGAIEYDSGWSTGDFDEPYYCLPDIPGWTGGPDVPPLNEECERAERKVEKATKGLEKAKGELRQARQSGREAKIARSKQRVKRAKQKAKKAKKKQRRACS